MKNNGPTFVFFGTAEFSIAILEELAVASFVPSLIVTQEDKPIGRKLVITSPPVKTWGEQHGVSVIQPKSLKGDLPAELISPGASRWDFFVIAAYGKILPRLLLDLPKHGTLNVHPSLLPKLRGASPIQAAILGDERQTGVTIMLVDEEMDHGPIVAQAEITVEDLPDGKAGWPPKASVLRDLLSHVGGELLAETIPLWLKKKVSPEEQDESQATYTLKIKKEDGLINLNDDPYENFKKIQAFDMWPGTYFFTLRGNKKIRVKITDAEFKDKNLVITRVTPEGKREMSYQDFLRG